MLVPAGWDGVSYSGMVMTHLRSWLACSITVLCSVMAASAFTTNDSAAIFAAFNNAFAVGGYYPGWWTGAEEIEMAEDAYRWRQCRFLRGSLGERRRADQRRRTGHIGSRKSGAATTYDNQFMGYIEEVAIYDYALSTNQVRAHYQAVTNRPPAFLSNPVTVASANAGQPYAATLTAYAGDPNGDTTSFSKISGPTWLSVASNGNLTGTPWSADAGTNVFTVRATDTSGLSTTATMNLIVLPAPGIILSAGVQGANLLLTWTGGITPYQVQVATNLLNPAWQNLGTPVSVNYLMVSPTNGTAFYRVNGR